MLFLQTTALATAKLSILCLLHRIFITRGLQIVVKILSAVLVLWWISFTFAFAFTCSPSSVNWEPEIQHHCRNREVVLISAPIPWTLADFVILIAPFVVKSLHTKRSNRIGLCALPLTGGR